MSGIENWREISFSGGFLNIPWQGQYRLAGIRRGKMDLSSLVARDIYMFIQFYGWESKNCPHQKECKARNGNYQREILWFLDSVITKERLCFHKRQSFCSQG